MKPLDHHDRARLRRPTAPSVRDQARRAQASQSPAGYAPPVAAVLEYAGTDLPLDGKWLWADGSKITETDYPDLFAALGTKFNDGTEAAGEASLPNHAGRVAVGAGTGSGLTLREPGQKFGEEQTILVVSQLPPHSHTLSYQNYNNTAGQGTLTRSVLGETGNTATTANAGNADPIENCQPSLVVSYIIRALP